MKLYEINEEILRLTDQIDIDEETGELLGNTEEVMKKLDALQMQKKSILEYLAKIVLNLKADAAVVKDEEQRLRARRQRLEKRQDGIMEVLKRECQGEKTNLGVVSLTYMNTTKLDVFNAEEAVKWLKRRKLTSCYRIPEPEVAKTEVKKLFKEGKIVPGCVLVQDRSYYLK